MPATANCGHRQRRCRQRQSLGDRYGAPHRFDYDAFDACLAEVDAVYICTPNSHHARYATRAARAGVHVLCEKPLAVTTAECAAMLEARDAGGVKMMTAYRLHFDPITLEVIGHARSGRLGDLRYFASSFSLTAKPGGIRTRAETGGGSVYDLGIYCINAARMLFATEPLRVSAHTIHGGRSGMPEVDETTAAVLHFEADRLATFTSSFASAGVSSYRIVGTEGEIAVEPAYAYAEPLAYTMTVGRDDDEEARPAPRSVRRRAGLLLARASSTTSRPSRRPRKAPGTCASSMRSSNRRGAASRSSCRRSRSVGRRPRSRRPCRRSARPALVNVESPHDQPEHSGRYAQSKPSIGTCW